VLFRTIVTERRHDPSNSMTAIPVWSSRLCALPVVASLYAGAWAVSGTTSQAVSGSDAPDATTVERGMERPAPPGQGEAPPLESAIDAWVDARSWVDAMKVPDAPPTPASPMAPRAPSARDARESRSREGAGDGQPALPTRPGATAIVIRLNGRVVGSGVDASPNPSDQLRRAVARAIELASLDDLIHQVPAEERAELGARMTIELELAGPPIPMPGRSIGQIIAKVEPALEAIAARRGERWSWAMPSIAQASNIATDPVRTCVALLQELSVDPKDLPTQELPESMAFYRAPTRRLAQRTPRDSPFEVVRGREVIPLTALSRVGRIEFSTALARHLDAHIVRPSPEAPVETQALKPLGIRGDYRPHLDIHRSLSAPPQDQALAALALAAFSRLEGAPDEAKAAARTGAVELLAALSEVAEIEEDPLASPAAVGIALLADAELSRGGEDELRALGAFRASLRRALAARLTSEADFDHTRAIELAAAASLEARHEPLMAADELTRRLDEAWSPPVGSTIVGTMPWLLLAERARGGLSDPVRAERIRALTVPLREALIRSQLGLGGPEEPSPDAAGGFALAGAAGTTATAQSARPTLALAIMLGEPTLTSESERSDAMRSQLMALRFLRQLAVDDRSAYAFRDRTKVIGGVCEALWDSTQPVAASAMTLLVMAESEPALLSAAERSRPSGRNPRNRSDDADGLTP